jgi:hypothetical protein
MDQIFELLKILLPAALVLYGMYLMVQNFMRKELEKKLMDIKMKNTELILPIRLQAYERMCLFLERITPANLIRRLNDSSFNTKDLQVILLKEIREEFNHNLSQQLYMSEDAWNQVKNAMEDVIALINMSVDQVDPESKSMELAKKILENNMNRAYDAIANALVFVKDEIRQVF